ATQSALDSCPSLAVSSPVGATSRAAPLVGQAASLSLRPRTSWQLVLRGGRMDWDLVKEGVQPMADQAPSQSKLKGWLKTFLGTLGGLLSGAVVMYVTPLVDKAVKPAKPIANFKFEADRQSLQVRFENLSTGGQGWWDFGDGSPLEQVLPGQHLVY